MDYQKVWLNENALKIALVANYTNRWHKAFHKIKSS
jgi:hypothetical protein